MPGETGQGLKPARGWRGALGVYRNPRLLFVLVMGFASGLPLLLSLSTLSYWLASVGVDKTAIGLFALVGLPYGVKFLWAPVLDHVRLPVLSRRLGRRRGWAVFIQALLIAAILVLAQSDPATAPLGTAAAAFAVAFFSASQDIVIDAYRIEILAPHEQGAGAAATQAGYRAGLLVAGAGAIALSDFIAWPAVFAVLAGMTLVGTAAVLLAPEPESPAPDAPGPEKGEGGRWSFAWVDRALMAPFADFARHPGWAVILAFVVLYKFGDAIGGVMANPFYVELGFTGVEIASVTKVFGMIATLAGVFAGGVLVARWGIFHALLVGGVLQAASNLLFALQAAVGHDIALLALTIGADNFTGGLGSAALVAYLSGLCNVVHTGTQYALLTSFMAAGRTLLSSGGGWLADNMDWISFFVLTTGLAVPGLALLLWLSRLHALQRARAA